MLELLSRGRISCEMKQRTISVGMALRFCHGGGSNFPFVNPSLVGYRLITAQIQHFGVLDVIRLFLCKYLKLILRQNRCLSHQKGDEWPASPVLTHTLLQLMGKKSAVPLIFLSWRFKITDRYLGSDSQNLPASVVRRFGVRTRFEFTKKQIFKLI